MPPNLEALQATLEEAMNRVRPGSGRLLRDDGASLSDLVSQEQAFIEACRVMYRKARLGDNDYYQSARDILRQTQSATQKSIFQTLAGVGLSIITLGLGLFSRSFRNYFFSNTSVEAGILTLRLDLLAQLQNDIKSNAKASELTDKKDERFSHDLLIACANKLGYEADVEGICYGFTMRWSEACLTGTQSVFDQRTQAITRLYAQLQQEEGLSDAKIDKEALWDIKAFYESLLLYQDPSRYQEIFNESLTQRDIVAVSQLAQSDAINALGGLLTTSPLTYGVLSKESIKADFEKIAEQIHQSAYKEPVPFLFVCSREEGAHAVNLTYFPATQQWQFMDVNRYPPHPATTNLEEAIQTMPFGNYDYVRARAILPATQEASVLHQALSSLPKFNHSLTATDRAHLLVSMIREKDQASVKSMLERDDALDLSITNKEGLTLLHIAAHHGSLEAVEGLIKQGIDLDQGVKGQTALDIAVLTKETEIVKVLIKGGADVNRLDQHGNPPLIGAVAKGHVDMVKALLAGGADANILSSSGTTPLLIGLHIGNVDLVNVLLEGGADVNFKSEDGRAPLFVAAQNGQNEMVKCLLAAGASIDCSNKTGHTPLIIAAQKGHLDIVKLLVEGLNTEDKQRILNDTLPDGATALGIAAQLGHEQVVHFLLESGADPHLAMKNGASPLYIASQNGHAAVVERLIAYGANPNQSMRTGAAPLYAAV